MRNMNPWLIIAVAGAGIVFLVDYLLRRHKWTDTTKKEQGSLLVSMVSIFIYAFLSVLGMLWGIVSSSPDTAIGKTLYNVTITLGEYYWVVAIAVVIATFILRKTGKPKASIWINVIALAYIAVVLGVNYLVGILI